MSRGGRGGKYQGGRPRGIETPFDIDPELLKAVDEADDERRNGKDAIAKELYPVITEHIVAAPITDAERSAVRRERHIQAKRRDGPFWTGARIEVIDLDAFRSPTESGFTADIQTFSNKRKKPPFQPANFKRVKVCYQKYFPKELQDLIVDTNGAQPERKKVNGLSKSTIEKLAKVVEEDKSPEDEISPTKDDPKVVNSDDEEGEEEEEGEIDILDEEPQDSEFDDEEDNDYNAEKYFDGGESDYDSGAGGDDGGGDGDDDY